MCVSMTALAEWQTFSEVVGSAAGALTGLQFVVMALISDVPMRSGESDAGQAFASPTIVHFVAVLMLAATLAMPWPGLSPVAVLWGLAGVAGVVYTSLVLRRMQRQSSYKPVLEDWFFHTILPWCAYGGLTASALLLPSQPQHALFGVAGVCLLLLFIGIHNAWDNVLYLVNMRRERLQGPPQP
jgi:hypothetical protein